MHTALRVGLVLGCLALGGGLAGGALARLGFFQETPPGFMIGGRAVDGAVPLGVWIDSRRSALQGRELTVSTGQRFVRVPMGELGAEVDVSATLREARGALEAARGPLGWWRLARRSRQGLVDIPLVFRVSPDRAALYLATLAPEVHRDPQNARLDLMNHERVADVPGAELDAEATTARIDASSFREGDVVEVATRPIKAAFTQADIANIDVSKVLASAESNFSLFGTGAGRAVNIATAAKRLDGWVIAPGEVFSFNKVVGPRELEAGFTYAPEIVDEELEMGVGGGTCQVSTTLHVAAVNGAFDVLERSGHSRPSSYARLGMDATVAYGKVDLKLRNPFSFPIIVHAFLPKPTVIRVELLGADPQAKVVYTFSINSSDDYYRRITYKPHLPPGKVHLHQKGIKGHEVASHVLIQWNNGRVTERSYLSAYRPVPEVFWVGRDVDETQLPELPEGVTRVQRRNFARLPKAAQATEPGGQPTSGLMRIFHEILGFRDACAGARASGLRVALVPTMGALHEGHLTLAREARRHAQFVVASVFVNPTQFGPSEDFSKYPRDLEGDARKLASAGVDVLFAPPREAMYPEGEQTRVRLGPITEPLCGAFRPGHFEGVATIVSKLFIAAGPCAAVFGRKDYQQLQVLRRMARDLLLPVEVVGVPTVREPDGLAMSSRNAYLSADDRLKALGLARGLRAAGALFGAGERRAGALRQAALAHVQAASDRIDYVTVADPDDLTPFDDQAPVADRALVAIAARVGSTRLIDNTVLGEDTLP